MGGLKPRPRLAPRMRVLLVVLSLLGASLLGSASLGASAGACKPGNVFENENVRVWFHGSKGMVKVFDANESREGGEGGDGSHYSYTTGEIEEVDADGNVVASMNLGRAFPRTSDCTVEDSGDAIHMTLTLSESVRAKGDAGEATVTFAYHFNKSSQGAKFDLRVEGWPWQSEESALRYAFDVHAGGATMEPAENGVGMRNADGSSRGYVEWAPNATATYEDGRQELAVVDAETRVTGSTARVVLAFTNATAGYAELDYDPWAGVGQYAVVAGRLVGLAPAEAALKTVARALPPRLP